MGRSCQQAAIVTLSVTNSSCPREANCLSSTQVPEPTGTPSGCGWQCLHCTVVLSQLSADIIVLSRGDINFVSWRHSNCLLETFQLSLADISTVCWRHFNCLLETFQLSLGDISTVSCRHIICAKVYISIYFCVKILYPYYMLSSIVFFVVKF